MVHNLVVNGSRFNDPGYTAQMQAREIDRLCEEVNYKMAFKPVEEQTNFIRFEKEDDELIGKLLKVEESSNYENVNVYTIEFESAKVSGEELKPAENQFPNNECRLFGSTVLDNRMSQVEIGSRIKIVYKGKTITTKKGKAKNYKVFVDQE